MKVRIRTSAASAVLVLAASLIAFGGTPGAFATQGQPVVAGVINTANSDTVFQLNDPDTPTCSSGNLFGVHACGWTGVFGQGRTFGVKGVGPTGIDGQGGTTGVVGDGDSTGVSGSGGATGVSGSGATGVEGSGTENGVQAQGGTFGVFATGTDYGVYASAPNHGVYGQATNTGGAGVDAAGTGGAVALRVTGKATFSRSGVVTVGAGTASLNVALAGVNAKSMILATAQQSTGVSVKAAVPAAPSSGHFTIYLTGNAPAGGLKVAYFILN